MSHWRSASGSAALPLPDPSAGRRAAAAARSVVVGRSSANGAACPGGSCRRSGCGGAGDGGVVAHLVEEARIGGADERDARALGHVEHGAAGGLDGRGGRLPAARARRRRRTRRRRSRTRPAPRRIVRPAPWARRSLLERRRRRAPRRAGRQPAPRAPAVVRADRMQTPSDEPAGPR